MKKLYIIILAGLMTCASQASYNVQCLLTLQVDSYEIFTTGAPNSMMVSGEVLSAEALEQSHLDCQHPLGPLKEVVVHSNSLQASLRYQQGQELLLHYSFSNSTSPSHPGSIVAYELLSQDQHVYHAVLDEVLVPIAHSGCFNSALGCPLSPDCEQSAMGCLEKPTSTLETAKLQYGHIQKTSTYNFGYMFYEEYLVTLIYGPSYGAPSKKVYVEAQVELHDPISSSSKKLNGEIIKLSFLNP
jgi:hypothetical protein